MDRGTWRTAVHGVEKSHTWLSICAPIADSLCCTAETTTYQDVMIEKSNSQDIVPIFVGHEDCKRSDICGPSAHDYYLIHFCINGCGTLHDKYGTHSIKAGELFVIRPHEIVTYTSDTVTPWEYSWIAFYGPLATTFLTDRSVYDITSDFGLEIVKLVDDNISSPSIYISLLYRLMHVLFSASTTHKGIVEQIKQYIRFNYIHDLTVDGIAEYFNFERSYLYRVFKRECGMSIKEFITHTRMEQAKILLTKGYSVSDTAYAVGYKDQFNFSKAYKKHYQAPPITQKTK